VERAYDGIAIVQDAIVQFVSPRFVKMMGYTEEEVIGTPFVNYLDQEEVPKIVDRYQRRMAGEDIVQVYETAVRHREGRRIDVEINVGLIPYRGRPAEFVIVRDITERKQGEKEKNRMEMELLQSKNFLQNIIDSSIDGITTTDLHGKITFITPMIADLLGYSPEEMIGNKVSLFYGKGLDDAKAIMKGLTENGELRNYELKLVHRDGSFVDILLSASLLRGAGGEPEGTLGIFKDITDKKRLEVQLRQAQRMEAIGTLAGGIAHDFNNLLMGIGGNASLMLMEIDSGHSFYERLKTIEKLVQMGARLTSQLLGYARKGRYEVRPIDLNRLLEDTSEAFGRTRKEIEIRRDLSGDLFPVMGDQGQIEQVLYNLYVNAADAMPSGGFLFLRTKNVTHEEIKGKFYRPKPGTYALIEVTDTGIGRDEGTKDRIFEPFFTTKEMGRGTGLGLASVYGIIKGHGGYIEVESEKGRGSTFMIYLPASRAEEEVRERRPPADELLKGDETILVVDDEEMVLGVCSRVLQFLGYTVIGARTGREAIEKFRERKDEISLVILDMIMPGMGGGKTYDLLKEIDPSVKVILSSGYSLDGQAMEIMERGCNGFIQKPFDIKNLSRKIREILDKK